MAQPPGLFVGLAAHPGQFRAVMLGAASPQPLARLTQRCLSVGPVVLRIAAERVAAQSLIAHLAHVIAMTRAGDPLPGGEIAAAAILGYLGGTHARRRGHDVLGLNEAGTVLRVAWLEIGWPLCEVTPRALAHFAGGETISEQDTDAMRRVWAQLDAGRGVNGGANGYGWAAALAHLARAARLPDCYHPWRAALAHELWLGRRG
jgi:hypothetical protein